MLTNYHMHTTFCDGDNTAEEMVLSAIDKGFSAIGFSGHGYTDYDLRYCVKDEQGYRETVLSLKEKYRDKIQIYLGIEEDSYCYTDRDKYDYIIGSCHYFCVNGKYYPMDSSHTHFKKCPELFDGNPLKMAEAYYSNFCDYILKRKPDIVGHFDLITKYDEMEESIFLNNPEYHKIAEKYLKEAIKSDCIFEINTGAIGRGYRQSPYPDVNLLHILKKNDCRIILSSDSHSTDTIDCYFSETVEILKDIGFTHTYVLYDGEFKKVEL